MQDNKYDHITNININSTDDFFLENIPLYKKLEKLNISNVNLTDFNIVKELFDNLNFSIIKTLNCTFKVCESILNFQIINEKVHLYIPRQNITNMKFIFNNLPLCIHSMYISHPSNIIETFDDLFNNLPTSLQQIEIEHAIVSGIFIHEKIKDLECSGKLNWLFEIKLAFGSKIVLHFTDYENNIIHSLDVIYENNNENELTLFKTRRENCKRCAILCENENIVIKKTLKSLNQTFYEYSVNYNFLKIMDGMGGLSFSN
jgi:hypothetical protein